MTNTHINIGGHKVSAGKVYSTSEVKTGDVWTDGKPIYRKVLTGTTPSTAGTTLHVSLGTSYVGKIIRLDGMIYRDATAQAPANYYYNDTNTCTMWLNGTNIDFLVNATDKTDKEFFIVVEYTKTTD